MKPSIPDAHADQNVFLVALAGIVYPLVMEEKEKC